MPLFIIFIDGMLRSWKKWNFSFFYWKKWICMYFYFNLGLVGSWHSFSSSGRYQSTLMRGIQLESKLTLAYISIQNFYFSVGSLGHSSLVKKKKMVCRLPKRVYCSSETQFHILLSKPIDICIFLQCYWKGKLNFDRRTVFYCFGEPKNFIVQHINIGGPATEV